MKTRTRLLAGAGVLLAVMASVAMATAWHWWSSPGPAATQTLVEIPRGDGPNRISQRLAAAGVLEHPRWFALAVRFSGRAQNLKAGEYAFTAGQSPAAVFAQVVAGQVTRYSVTFIEGQTVAEAWQRVRSSPYVKATPGLALSGLMKVLGEPAVPAEGAFFPDTYVFRRGTSDVEVMREARKRMQQELAAAWEARQAGLPLRDPSEALVLASLVEKETGAADERPMIAGVFINRLRVRMRLQTDPAVIYGLGSAYDGNLRKADLRRDGPYNTYRRGGLPPTAIALPGRGSLLAATQPAATEALYFVATGRGDGRHVFSATLKAHNAAVRALVARTRETAAK
jgi:UPF0755 protein